MTKHSRIFQYIRWFFLFCVLGVLMYLLIGESIMPAENRAEKSTFDTFSEGWVWIKDDGTREPIEIPGKCDVERNELVVVENVLPADVDDKLYMCIRSSKQEMKVYIDGGLRQEYSTKDTRLYGRISSVAMVFVELRESDAGKIIRIETQTDSSYTGVFHEIHYGERWEIWSHYWDDYGIELLISIFMIILSVASIIISVALRVTYKKPFDIEYLGWAVFLAALWIMSNSVFRQILFPNITVINDLSFILVMFLPMPFMFYLNSVQKGRYEKAYFVVTIIDFIDFFICTALHILNIVDFTDSIKVVAACCGISIGMIAVTIFIDMFKGLVKQYRLVAIALGLTCFLAVLQLFIYFKWTNQFTGSYIALSLVVILTIAFVKTMREVLNTEKEKQQALLSSESKSKFLANASHEIRTPINAILGMDSMILRESTDENIREYASNIQDAGQALLSIVNDILDISKIESGKMELIQNEYDFSNLINDAINMIAMKADEKGLEKVISVDSNIPCKLLGDAGRIRQILVNLLTNAVKYTNEGRITLNVTAEVLEEDVKLTFLVEDTGVGIKEEDISKLFARFERIDDVNNIEGSGLGINITMQLLKMMGSELKVESEYEKGSRFSFELTQKIINKEPIGDLWGRIKNKASENDYHVSYIAPKAKVLVVDDNAINLKVFVNLLKQTQIQIDKAESGKECIEKVLNKRYDMIFLDHMMPEMDGIETLHHLNDIEGFSSDNTPVIALTANAIAGASEMYKKEGFTKYLSKPIQPEKLEKLIFSLLPKEKVQIIEKEIEIQQEINLPKIDGIDWELAMEHASDYETLKETLNVFYTTLDADADFLEGLYNKIKFGKDEVLNYRIKIHAMGTSANLIGASELCQKARKLESAARELNAEMIISDTKSFLKEWRSYKEKLKICMENNDKKQIEDIEGIKKSLNELKTAMDNLNIDLADEISNQLSQYEYPDTVRSDMDSLFVHVMNLDADQANMVIDIVLQKI